MTDDRDADEPAGLFEALLMPLRLPGRVVSDIGLLTNAVVALQSDAKRHLSSVDKSAGELVEGVAAVRGVTDEIRAKVDKLEEERMEAFLGAVGTLQSSIDRIEGRMKTLASLEATITDLIGDLRQDLNERMIAVEHEVRAMRPPMQEMASDVAKIDELLPDPKDGPFTRLKDTLTSN